MAHTQPGEQLIYDSQERGDCYRCIRVLWCACCEPYHTITTQYVKVHRCQGCAQVTDSMSMQAIFDVRRVQPCCCCLASCFCGCCIEDFGNVRLFGRDDTNVNGILLKNVAHSKKVTMVLTKHLQTIHKDFRQQGRNLGAKLEEVKKEH